MGADHLLNCVEKGANCGSPTSASYPRKPLVFQGSRGPSLGSTARLKSWCPRFESGSRHVGRRNRACMRDSLVGGATVSRTSPPTGRNRGRFSSSHEAANRLLGACVGVVCFLRRVDDPGERRRGLLFVSDFLRLVEGFRSPRYGRTRKSSTRERLARCRPRPCDSRKAEARSEQCPRSGLWRHYPSASPLTFSLRKRRIVCAMNSSSSSNAKCPVSRRCSSALGRSRL
jgi:hypothetical protein